jgi:hypothetical protein
MTGMDFIYDAIALLALLVLAAAIAFPLTEDCDEAEDGAKPAGESWCKENP